MSNEEFIGHSATPLHTDGQKLSEHLNNVADICARFFEDASELVDIARAVCVTHDAGKYTQAVQRYLRGIDKERTVHATLGGQILAERYGMLGRLLAFAVMGHHGGMPDGAGGEGRSLESRLMDAKDADALKHFFAENALPDALRPPLLANSKESLPYDISMLVRMIFSALVDADYLDTEAYFEPETAARRAKWASWQTLTERYERYMLSLTRSARDTHVNRVRADVLAQCHAAGRLKQGIYSLTVPTGGGKTLASLGFAIEHIKEHKNIKRVVYAIPYTSIIEQNAQVFRDALGDDGVLEHHSSIDFSDYGISRLASENWDAPLIVTTNVQLFESLYAANPSRCRKVHNLRNSIIILDEAQALPDGMLRPCLEMLCALSKNWNATIVLMTATQPELSGVWREVPDVREIILDIPQLFDSLRRTEIEFLGGVGDDELCARLRAESRALCIVNSRAHARDLYKRLADDEGVYHLSALMCPKHRTHTLNEIRERLESESARCVVISTSLVEAGVDLDFPTVYRALAGLDSVAQAAGRCNRNGLMSELGNVRVFIPVDAKMPAQFQKAGNDALQLVGLYDDLLSKPALDNYFRMRFGHGADLDTKRILPRIAEQMRGMYPFRSIAADFRMISSAGEPLIIPYDADARALIDELRSAEYIGQLSRSLRAYSVTVYPNQMKALSERGFITRIGEVCVLDVASAQFERLYSPEFGLNTDGDVRLSELFV